ncbi:hypothetical protein E2562_036122 [Oryza meyeriana var. granulata]|uniref:Uncharacterized protein n=1 Tax=Oryza meyeriana var. granulata TaxID=110450 RepID=A0A6G1CLC1_9ORYZ|nr:hypothetical protein E2562_036122 [Oryza meyeriana var. granulata]
MSPPLSDDWSLPRLGSPPSSPESGNAVLIEDDDSKEDRFFDRSLSDYDWSNLELEGFRCSEIFDQVEDEDGQDDDYQDDDDDDKDAKGVKERTKEGGHPIDEDF